MYDDCGDDGSGDAGRGWGDGGHLASHYAVVCAAEIVGESVVEVSLWELTIGVQSLEVGNGGAGLPLGDC